jgi:hypothetical protein
VLRSDLLKFGVAVSPLASVKVRYFCQVDAQNGHNPRTALLDRGRGLAKLLQPCLQSRAAMRSGRGEKFSLVGTKSIASFEQHQYDDFGNKSLGA